MPPKERAAKCPVQGCKVHLTPATKAACKHCKTEFCKDHSFPSDHGCMRLSGGMSRSASAPQLVKPPAAVPGLLVSAAANSSKASAAAVAAAKVRESAPGSWPACACSGPD